jgi:hypothetical protein
VNCDKWLIQQRVFIADLADGSTRNRQWRHDDVTARRQPCRRWLLTSTQTTRVRGLNNQLIRRRCKWTWTAPVRDWYGISLRPTVGAGTWTIMHAIGCLFGVGVTDITQTRSSCLPPRSVGFGSGPSSVSTELERPPSCSFLRHSALSSAKSVSYNYWHSLFDCRFSLIEPLLIDRTLIDFSEMIHCYRLYTLLRQTLFVQVFSDVSKDSTAWVVVVLNC